jgi:hypothetical protein
MPAIRALWTEHDPPEGAAVLDRWADLAPHAVRVVRDRSGGVAGCSVTCEWRTSPSSLERNDPVVAAWLAHGRRHPLPPGQKTLVHRRALAVGAGEAPGPVQAATMLDVKRDYFTMRPHLGRLYFVVANPEPLMPALVTLGFAPLEQPVVVGDVAFHLAALDFGPESIDGWLANLAAAELGIPRSPLLDAGDRTVDVQGVRVQLSPLEFGVLEALHERSGKPVSRVDLDRVGNGVQRRQQRRRRRRAHPPPQARHVRQPNRDGSRRRLPPALSSATRSPQPAEQRRRTHPVGSGTSDVDHVYGI